jgi:tetratricopeptide (TPR) repeat protein
MQRSCPICGAETFPGARFCRRCGAPVRHAGDDGDAEVSPQAATVPLSEQDRSTEALGPEEPGRAADTSRVSRAELERLLQAQQTGDIASAELGRRTAAAAAAETHAAPPEAPRTTHPEHPGLDTSAGHDEELDEELTVTVPRPSRPLDTRETASAPPPPGAAAQARPRRLWPLVVALCGVGLVFAVAAAWLGARFLLRPAPTDVSTQPPAPPAPDPDQLFEEKLAEAESLLAQGNMEGALAALDEANRLVPSNTRAHQRRGELLVAAGRRREAVEEFRAVTRAAPDDFAAWRQLAAAQTAEGLHADAAESYGRLVAIVGEASADPNDLLSYADALRLSGRQAEARALYERLAARPFDGAALARQRLNELALPTPAPTPDSANGQRPPDAQTGETASSATPAPPVPTPTQVASTTQPPPAPPARPAEGSPAERYQRGVELWSSNRAAAVGEFRAAAGAGSADAHYYLGLSYVEGRSLQSLKRAEIVAALAHFQHAQRGQFAGQARRYTQQLEREFDRIRKQ